jgi:hypothetical protein
VSRTLDIVSAYDAILSRVTSSPSDASVKNVPDNASTSDCKLPPRNTSIESEANGSATKRDDDKHDGIEITNKNSTSNIPRGTSKQEDLESEDDDKSNEKAPDNLDRAILGVCLYDVFTF